MHTKRKRSREQTTWRSGREIDSADESCLTGRLFLSGLLLPLWILRLMSTETTHPYSLFDKRRELDVTVPLNTQYLNITFCKKLMAKLTINKEWNGLFYTNKNVYFFKVLLGGGRNFERPIFRNFKIANVKSYEVQLSDFLIYEIIFSFFKNYLNT